MNFIRVTMFNLVLVLTLAWTQAKPLHQSSSLSPSLNNLDGYIKYLLRMIGTENEYLRFLTYLKIYPPNHGTQLRRLYDELFSFDAYIADMTHMYEKYYTPDEILQLVDFYSSPLGKKTLALNIDVNQQMEDTMLNKITDYVFTAAEHNIHIPLPEIH